MADKAVVGVVAPSPQTMSSDVMPGPGFSALEGRKRFVIKQKFEKLEAAAQMLLGNNLVETGNKYEVFDADSGEVLMFVQEESTCFCRTCFAPHHEAKLHFYDVRPGMAPMTLVMSGEKPFKIGCWAFHDLCRDEINIHDAQGQSVGSLKVPKWGGGLTPTLEILDTDGKVQTTTRGPTCCIGGLVELFSGITFGIFDGTDTTKQTGSVQKVKPANFQGALKEATGDADTYMLIAPEGLTSEGLARLLMGVILTDYMFFEDGAPVQGNMFTQECHINLCNCFCYGCICQCSHTCRASDFAR